MLSSAKRTFNDSSNLTFSEFNHEAYSLSNILVVPKHFQIFFSISVLPKLEYEIFLTETDNWFKDTIGRPTSYLTAEIPISKWRSGL